MHDHMYNIARPNFDASFRFEPPLMIPELAFTSPHLYLGAGVTTLRTTGSVDHVALTSTLHVFENDDPIRFHPQQRVLDTMSPPTREAYLAIRSFELTRAGSDADAAKAHAALFTNDMALEREFVAAGGLLLAGYDSEKLLKSALGRHGQY